MANIEFYDIHGVRGERMVAGKRKGAPTEAWMIGWAKDRNCQAVVRYYPSRKGWRLLDVRNARKIDAPGQRYAMWKGQVRQPQFWPNVDAAIMAWLHRDDGQP
jgi:hypothetical protein